MSRGAPAQCPDCGADVGWDLQDTLSWHGIIFSERSEVCESGCGWLGAHALFPWKGSPEMPTADPFGGRSLADLRGSGEPMRVHDLADESPDPEADAEDVPGRNNPVRP